MTTPAAAPDVTYRSPFLGWPSRAYGYLQLQTYYAFCYSLNHPWKWRWILSCIVRRFRPVAIAGKNVVVVKARDVRDVANRMEDFTIADVLGPLMPWGPFMLTVDWPEQHKLERNFLQSIVQNTDVDIIRQRAAAKCRALIDESKAKAGSGLARIDVVADLCEPVVADMIENYFGVPDIGSKNPINKSMAVILGNVAGYFIVTPPRYSPPGEEAIKSMDILSGVIIRRIKAQLKLIKSQSGERPTPSDLLTRLLVRMLNSPPSFLNTDWIRRYITGLAVFGGGTITRASVHAIDRLLEFPEHIASARTRANEIIEESEPLQSAKTRERLESSRDPLRQVIYEALRFRPMLPFLRRYIPRETVIAEGSPDARLVPMGKEVLAVAAAAMFDPEEFEGPSQFKCDRSLKTYLHFGPEGGPRFCFGKYVADALIVEIISALLRYCDQWKRVNQVQYYNGGLLPQSLCLTYS
jgi:cytochrome P450